MDKTIEIVLVAVVAIVTASILLFMMQNRADSFGGFLDDQSQGAKCDLWKTQAKNQLCEGGEKTGSLSDELSSNLDQCSGVSESSISCG